jgi:hypothetical protein
MGGYLTTHSNSYGGLSEGAKSRYANVASTVIGRSCVCNSGSSLKRLVITISSEDGLNFK